MIAAAVVGLALIKSWGKLPSGPLATAVGMGW